MNYKHCSFATEVWSGQAFRGGYTDICWWTLFPHKDSLETSATSGMLGGGLYPPAQCVMLDGKDGEMGLTCVSTTATYPDFVSW